MASGARVRTRMAPACSQRSAFVITQEGTVQHMPRWLLVIVVDVCATAAKVSAQDARAKSPVMVFEGDVIAASSHRVDDGSRIVTEATVHTSDGRDVTVSQL